MTAVGPTPADMTTATAIVTRPSLPTRPSMLNRLARASRRSIAAVSLPSFDQIRQSITTWQVYIDSFSLILTMIRQSIFSGAVAFATNLVYPQGFLLLGKSPANQSYAEFLVGTMANANFFIGLMMWFGITIPLAKLRHINYPDAPQSLGFWLLLMARRTILPFVVSFGAVCMISYACAMLSDKWRPLQLHFYVTILATHIFTSSLDAAARTLFQSQTVEGLARGHINRSPVWKRFFRTYVNLLPVVFAMYTPAAYIHISSHFELRSQRDFVIFSFASLAFRVVVLSGIRTYLLRLKKVQARMLYIYAIMPTVFINTQMRVALVRVQANVSFAGLIMFALVEPVMRVFKVWKIRQQLLRRRSSSSSPGPRVSWATEQPHGITPAVVAPSPTTRPTDQQRVRSRVGRAQKAERLLQFTAAELHADMCSEYIAIACTLSIYYCLRGRKQFTWSLDSAASSNITLVLAQLAIEIIVDFACCLWELVNGIPLKSSPALNGFLTIMFTGCAVTNISLCCMFNLRYFSD